MSKFKRAQNTATLTPGLTSKSDSDRKASLFAQKGEVRRGQLRRPDVAHPCAQNHIKYEQEALASIESKRKRRLKRKLQTIVWAVGRVIVHYYNSRQICALRIDRFTCFVPSIVTESLPHIPLGIGNEAMPSAEFHGAVVFADISGFSALTEQLSKASNGAEKLCAILNGFFGVLVQNIVGHGGDVVKFSGDAVTCVWRSPSASEEDMTKTVLRACQASIESHRTVNNHAKETDVDLSLHLGVGCGLCRFLHVGGAFGRWEFVLSGAPFAQIKYAVPLSESHETVLSQQAWQAVSKLATGEPRQDSCVKLDSVDDTSIVQQDRQWTSKYYLPSTADLQLEHSHVKMIKRYIPGAVHKAIMDGHTGPLAEMRMCTVVFIEVLGADAETITRTDLQSLMEAIQYCIYVNEGSVNKMIVDDKGLLVLCAFGLPPLAHSDDPERAVDSAKLVVNSIGGMSTGVESYSACVGVATGSVFCGVVGSNLRREYTTMGNSVNLAARLMGKAKEGTVLVDDTTYRRSKTGVNYIENPPLKLKGMEGEVKNYSPGEKIEQETSKMNEQDLQYEQVHAEVRQEACEKLTSNLKRLLDRGGGTMVMTGERGSSKGPLTNWLRYQTDTEAGIALGFQSVNMLHGMTEVNGGGGDHFVMDEWVQVFDALLVDYASKKMESTDQSKFSKYTLMLKLMPKEGVRERMEADGVSKADISTFFVAELDEDVEHEHYEEKEHDSLPSILGAMAQEEAGKGEFAGNEPKIHDKAFIIGALVDLLPPETHADIALLQHLFPGMCENIEETTTEGLRPEISSIIEDMKLRASGRGKDDNLDHAERTLRRQDMCILLLHQFRIICGPTVIIIRLRTASSQTWGRTVMQPQSFALLAAVMEFANGSYIAATKPAQAAMFRVWQEQKSVRDSFTTSGSQQVLIGQMMGLQGSGDLQGAYASWQSHLNTKNPHGIGSGLKSAPSIVLHLIARPILEHTNASDELKLCFTHAEDFDTMINVKACLEDDQARLFLMKYLKVEPTDVSDALFDIVLELSAGNPSDIQAVVEFWMMEGLVVVDKTRTPVIQSAGEEQLRDSIPQSVEGHLREVFDQQSPKLQELLKTMSLLKEPISQQLVQMIIDSDADLQAQKLNEELDPSIQFLITCELMRPSVEKDFMTGQAKVLFTSQVMRRLASEMMLQKRKNQLVVVIEAQEARLNQILKKSVAKHRFVCDRDQFYNSAFYGSIILTRFIRYAAAVKGGRTAQSERGMVFHSLTHGAPFKTAQSHAHKRRVIFEKSNRRKSAYDISAISDLEDRSIKMQGSLLKGAVGQFNWSKGGSWVERYFRVFGHYLQYYNDRNSKSIKGVLNLYHICGCWLHADLLHQTNEPRDNCVIDLSFSPSPNLPATQQNATKLQLKAVKTKLAQEWADLFMGYLVDNMQKRWGLRVPPKRRQSSFPTSINRTSWAKRSSLLPGKTNSNEKLGVKVGSEPPAPAMTPIVSPRASLKASTIQEDAQVQKGPSSVANSADLQQARQGLRQQGSGTTVQPPNATAVQVQAAPPRLMPGLHPGRASIDLTDAATMEAVQKGEYSGVKADNAETETRIFL